jgi:hypothetical protein
LLRSWDGTTGGRVAGTPLGVIDGRFVGKAGTTSSALCVGDAEGASLGIPDDRLGAKLGAPDGPRVGKADGIADGLGAARGTTLGGIDDAEDDDPKSKPLGLLDGACVGSLLGLFDGVPDGTMLCTKLGVADGPVVGTADVAKVRFSDRFVGGLVARLGLAVTEGHVVGASDAANVGLCDGRLEDASLGPTDGSELDRPLGPSVGAAEPTTLVLRDTVGAVVGAAEGSLLGPLGPPENVLGADD